MSEKPEKRLVSKGHYVKIKALALFLSGGALLCCLTIVLMLANVYHLETIERVEANKVEAKGGFYDPLFPDSLIVFGQDILLMLPISLVGYFLCKGGRKYYTVVRIMEPITDHNAHLLPVQDTLVRGSDLPPTIQQAELLRATQVAQEMPDEQLLRATIGEE